MRLFQVFENQFAASRLVKRENHGPELPEQLAQPARDLSLELAAVDRLAAQSSGHCTIGRNKGRIRSQAQALEQRRRIGRAPSGSDGHRDSGLLRGLERLRSPPAYLPRKGRQQGAIHVNCYQPERRVHVSSVSGGRVAGMNAGLCDGGHAQIGWRVDIVAP